MDYDVQIRRNAQKSLRSLPREVLEAIEVAEQDLAKNPRPPGVTKLKGELEGLWRIRIRGNYRLVYGIDDERRVVTIVKVGPRGGVYQA
jgi:mRNA interferase RelE/StbE